MTPGWRNDPGGGGAPVDASPDPASGAPLSLEGEPELPAVAPDPETTPDAAVPLDASPDDAPEETPVDPPFAATPEPPRLAAGELAFDEQAARPKRESPNRYATRTLPPRKLLITKKHALCPACGPMN
jgi:hypothetical protein